MAPEPEDVWTPPKWLKHFNKAELQQLAAAQHERIQRLQIQCRQTHAAHDLTAADGTHEQPLPATPAEDVR